MRKLAVVGLSGLYAVVFLAHCVGEDVGPPASSPSGDGGGADTAANPVEGSSTTTDAGGTDAAVADADPGPPCDLSKPFGLVKPLTVGTVNTSADETYGRMTDDGRELFFSRGKKVFRAARVNTADPWGDAVEVTKVNRRPGDTATEVLAPTLTGDGLTMFMQLYNGGSYGDVYTSTRAALGSLDWSAPVAVPAINGGAADDGTWITRSGLRLYWFTGPPFHTVFAERSSTSAAFGGATRVINGLAEDRNAVLSEDERTVYFSSDTRSPAGGALMLRTYVATRASLGVAFTNPVYEPDLNSETAVTEPTWLSKDGCTVIVHSSSGRPGQGGYDLFTAVRPK